MARSGTTRRLCTACTLLTVVLAVAGAGCGSSSRTVTRTITNPAGSSGSPAPSHPASAPTCSQFCLQAGPEGGPNGDGCQKPNGQSYSSTTPDGCLECPSGPGQCLDIVSTQATAQNGIVMVRLRCRISTPCDGALLLLQPNKEIAPDGSKLPPGQWVAGSDIHVPPSSTSDVPVKLTSLGQRLAQSPAGYRSVVSVQIKVYGGVGYRSAGGATQPMLTVHA